MRTLRAPLPLIAVIGPDGRPTGPTFDSIRTAPEGGRYTFEHLLYDTITYPAAGLDAGVVKAFGDAAGARAADDTLTNWPAAGRLDGQAKFHGLALFATYLTEPTVGAAVPDGSGRVRDIDRIVNTARCVLDFAISGTGRRRPPILLRAVPSLPGQRVALTPPVASAAAAGATQVHQQMGAGDGYPFDLPLAGNESFSLALRTKPGAVAISADLLIQLSVWGWMYQPTG